MNDLRHTVSVQEAVFEGWHVLSAFRWFNDAKAYAIKASKQDRLGRVFVIENSNRPTFFQNGAEIDSLEHAA